MAKPNIAHRIANFIGGLVFHFKYNDRLCEVYAEEHPPLPDGYTIVEEQDMQELLVLEACEALEIHSKITNRPTNHDVLWYCVRSLSDSLLGNAAWDDDTKEAATGLLCARYILHTNVSAASNAPSGRVH